MLPQIPLHSMPTSMTGSPLAPAPDTAQTANFAAVFAADTPRLQPILLDEEAGQVQRETDVPDENVEGDTSKQAQTPTEPDGTLPKDVPPAAASFVKGDVGATRAQTPKLGEALPDSAHAPEVSQTATVQAKDLDNSQPSEGTKNATLAIIKPAPDPWQVAVLAKDTVTRATLTVALDNGLAPPTHLTDPDSPPTTALPPTQTVPKHAENTRAQDAQRSAPAPFESRLTAEFAVPPAKQESMLVARFADPSQTAAQISVQPTPQTTQAMPFDGRALDAPNTPNIATAPTHTLTPSQPEPRTIGATPAPPPSALASAPPPAVTPKTIAGALDPKPQTSAPLNPPPQPTPNAAIPATPLPHPAGTSVPVAQPQSNTVVPKMSPKQPTSQSGPIAVKATSHLAERRSTARFEPMPAQLTAPPAEAPKLAAPLVPWQAITPAPLDQPTSKETLAIDPISGEPRVSSLAAHISASGSIQRPELPPQIARQLAEAIQQNPNRPVEITLKPHELGAVRLSVQQAEMGIIVNLTAERPETLELMRRHIDQLGQDFQAMGYANIAFSFAGGEAGTDAHSDDAPTHQGAETEDASAVPAAHIHLATGTTGGVDLRL